MFTTAWNGDHRRVPSLLFSSRQRCHRSTVSNRPIPSHYHGCCLGRCVRCGCWEIGSRLASIGLHSRVCCHRVVSQSAPTPACPHSHQSIVGYFSLLILTLQWPESMDFKSSPPSGLEQVSSRICWFPKVRVKELSACLRCLTPLQVVFHDSPAMLRMGVALVSFVAMLGRATAVAVSSAVFLNEVRTLYSDDPV
jgi:hypothetical protein